MLLAVGLGFGASATQALWRGGASTWGTVTIQRGQVGFAVERDPGAQNAARLVDDAGSPNDYSVHIGYGTRRDLAGSADQGSQLSGHLGAADIDALRDGQIGVVYAKYVVSGLAVGNSLLTYSAGITAPPAGVTATASADLYLVPPDEYGDPEEVDCAAYLATEPADPADKISYPPSGNPPVTTHTLVSLGESTDTAVWCLKVHSLAPPGGTHTNTGSITVDSGVGVKSGSDEWTATLTYTEEEADQLAVWFTPTVSRWEP
ncbi:MAG: hypothetical protein LBD97_04755 [Bifidobacteriaceae bacterium]|nr:hypothetical protein [Bifidobacteriaceae bacterium]